MYNEYLILLVLSLATAVVYNYKILSTCIRSTTVKLRSRLSYYLGFSCANQHTPPIMLLQGMCEKWIENVVISI